MSESARPNIPEIIGEVEGKSERIYTREEVIKAHKEGLSLMAAAAGRNELRPDQLVDFDISSYGFKNAYKDRFGKPKKSGEYGKVDVVINGDLEKDRQFTYKEGPAVEGIINFLGEQIAKTDVDDLEERQRLQELQRTLLENSQLHNIIHIRKSDDHKVGRVLAEAQFISEDERRSKGNDTDNYYAAMFALDRRRELVLPSARKSNTPTTAANGVVGTKSPVPVRADGTPEGPAAPAKPTTGTQYPVPAPVKAAMAAREASGVKPPAPEVPGSGVKKETEDLPPSPAGEKAKITLTADEVSPHKPENLEEDDELSPAVTDTKETVTDTKETVTDTKEIRKEKIVLGIGNRQRDIESRARLKATEAVNEQLRSGNWFRKIWTRLREVYLTELYTQRLMEAMKEHDNVNVDFDPIKNALRSVQGGENKRRESQLEAKAALEHASSDETIEGEVMRKISKTTHPELYDAFLTDILKPTYDGSIANEKDLQKKLAEFVKKNTASTVDPKIREPLLAVFGSDDKQLASVAEYFATDVMESVGKLRETNQVLSEIDDLIEIELSNVRWGAETQTNYKWHDKVMNWTKGRWGGATNPFVAGVVSTLVLGKLLAQSSLRKSANILAPGSGLLLGAFFSAARRNTELKTDRATYMAERAVGGEKKTTADNRSEFRKLINADTMRDMGNFEYDMVDAKDLSYGGGARLLDDEGKFVDDPSKRKERLSLEALITGNDTAGMIDRIAEIRARRNYGAKNGVDLIRVDDSNKVQRDRNLQLDNTLKMLRQELATQGMTEERIKELTGEAEKKWIAAFDQDVSRQDEAFGKYKAGRVAVGAATSFFTGLAGVGILAGGRELLQETGAGQAAVSALGRGANALRENARNLNMPDILQNSAFNALGPINGPAVRFGLNAMDQARDQVVDGVRANLPGIGHGLQVMFEEAPALNALGELGENAMDAARDDLADAGVQFDRFGNAIGENVRGIGAGLNEMADKAPAVGAVREFFDNLFDNDAAVDATGAAADTAADAVDQAAGQIDTDLLEEHTREYLIKSPVTIEDLKDHYDHYTNEFITIGEPSDNLEMHITARTFGFYHADGTAFGNARGIIEADGSLKLTGEVPSTLKKILADEGFTITDGASRVETILQEIKGTVESPLDGNMTIIPEGTEWRPQGDGTYDLVFSDKPDQVLINDARFDTGGRMIWNHNESLLTGNDISFEETPVTETGRSTVNIVSREGVWGSNHVSNVENVWHWNDIKGESDMNEQGLQTIKQGRRIILQMSRQDISFQDSILDDGMPSAGEAQVDVRAAFNELRGGYSFNLPGSDGQVIIVQAAADGSLVLDPDAGGSVVHIWNGQNFNDTMDLGEFSRTVLNPDAYANLPDGNIATEFNGHQEVFNLGYTSEDGQIVRGGHISAAMPEQTSDGRTLLHRFATIRGTGNASAEFSVTPGEPTEGLNHVVRIDIPEQTREVPTYEITPPLDRTVPVDPVPHNPALETPTPTTPVKPEYTTYIPVVSTPGVTEDRYNILADAVIPTNLTPRDALDPRGGKPGKEKKPGETPEELKEKSPLDSEAPGVEPVVKAPKEKAVDDAVAMESRAEFEASQLPVGESYKIGRSDQDRILPRTQLANGLVVGIFDGHGKLVGHRAAEYARDNFAGVFSMAQMGKTTQEALRDTFLSLNGDIRSEESKTGDKYGGTTAAVAYIEGSKVTVANVGDAEAYLINADGSSLELTHPHKAEQEAEQDRIRQAGGVVAKDDAGFLRAYTDINKTTGGLMVSRALGDSDMGDIISADPFISEGTIKPDTQWLIVASDGFWDAGMQPSYLHSYISQVMTEHPGYTEKEIADALVEQAYRILDDFNKNHPDQAQEIDDISLQLVDLRGYVKKK